MKCTVRRVAVGLVFFSTAGLAWPQSTGVTRTMVTSADISVPNREAVIQKVELAPGASTGWHTHPGDENVYVAEGELTLQRAGQAAQKFSAGQGFVIANRAVHNGTNNSAMPVRLVVVSVIEKGQPRSSPAEAPAQ
jgi:quercetin dioxygenase-like cupin family protein